MMLQIIRNKWLTISSAIFVIILIVVFSKTLFHSRPVRHDNSYMMNAENYSILHENNTYFYHRNMPLIFIGGVPRSGTTLMRAMLDAHPEVRCGQETRVIPRILNFFANWLTSEKESKRLDEAGVSKAVLERAVGQFCLEIIAHHGAAAPHLCNKDPLTLKHGMILRELFPNSKFLFMVRDGRASVHSMISRKVTVTGFDLTSYRASLKRWNMLIKKMYIQCKALGKENCLLVHYERLVIYPKETMEMILKFLDIPWSDNVLHHEDFINKENGIILSNLEKSTDQVAKAINLDALDAWAPHIPVDVSFNMAQIAPMLEVLGYDPRASPPNYQEMDFIVDDTKLKYIEDAEKSSEDTTIKFTNKFLYYPFSSV